MRVVDSHTHLDTLTWRDLEDMHLGGIEIIISPIQLDAAKPVDCRTIRDMWDYLFDVQFGRASENLIKPFAMIGISMVSTPRGDASELYEALPFYLKRPDVVAIGEIGFEPNSGTCKDIKMQEVFMRRQLELALQADINVCFHVPNPADLKKHYTERTLDLCRECGQPMAKTVVDHCSEANLSTVLEAGAHAAISVQPWRGMTPERAADLALEYGPERIMIDSDCSGLPSDPLAVPRTAVALRRKGTHEEKIERILYHNAKAFFGI